MGMGGYYRKFISRFADAARPMTKLTRKAQNLNGLMTVSQVLSI